MKSLIGNSYEEIADVFGTMPEKHYYSSDSNDGFSVFISGNEFLFTDGSLFSIEISEFSAVHDIPGFTYPLADSLEHTLVELDRANLKWSVYSKYTQGHWVVINLPEHSVLYEYEFVDGRFKLHYIRVEITASAH